MLAESPSSSKDVTGHLLRRMKLQLVKHERRLQKETGLLEASANVSDGNSRTALLSAPYVLMRGGVPITKNGICIGSVGVSGVAPDQDEQVAKAAVDALASTISKL